MRKSRKGGKKLQKNHLTRISKTRRMRKTRKHNKRKTKHLKKSINYKKQQSKKNKLYKGGECLPRSCPAKCSRAAQSCTQTMVPHPTNPLISHIKCGLPCIAQYDSEGGS